MSKIKYVPLHEVATFMGGSTPHRQNEKYFGGGIPWVKTTDLNNSLIVKTEETLTELGLKESSCKMIDAGAVLVAMYGGFNQIGRTGVLTQRSAINQALTAVIPDSKKLNPIFLNEWLNYRVKYWIRFAVSSRKDPNITKSDVEDFPVPLLNIDYQNKAVDILENWTNSIKNTERLIVVKEQYFRELSKQLFTLQESENWTEVKLETVCDISKGVQLSRSDMIENAIYPVLNGGIQPSGYTDEWNTEANTITISEGGNSCGFVSYMTQNFWCGGHCYALKQAQISKEYLFHYLKANEKAIMSLRVGSGLPNIQKKALGHFHIKYPKDEAQQIKIAEILNTAKREIYLLKKLAESYGVQKRGLMQKLLSGEWRVAG